MIGESRRQAFEQAIERYVDFYLGHMALEEREILSAGQEKVLTEQDWADLDPRHFSAKSRSIDGVCRTSRARLPPRFSPARIVNAVPAPIGLGAQR